MARHCRSSEKGGNRLKCRDGSGRRLSHALFDEINAMHHSSRTMRILNIFLALAWALPALSQTNTPEFRRMTLEDCIETALQHNFDIQIKRYNPEIARFNLRAVYGAYDPTFSASGE